MRRRTLTAAFAAFVATGPANSDTLSDRGFQAEVIGLLARSHRDWTVTPGDDAQSIKVGANTVYLGNLLAHVRDMEGAERQAEILAFVEHGVALAGAQTAQTFEEAHAKLRLEIVPAEFMRASPKLVHRSFTPDLLIAYAIDDEKGYQLIVQDTLDEWRSSQDAIERQATANLEAASTGVAVLAKPNAGGGAFLSVSTADGYDAARLLLPAFMRRVRAALRSPVVFAGIPNRDFLITWSPDFAPRRLFAERIVKDVESQPHPLTATLFTSTDDGVRLADAAERADHGR